MAKEGAIETAREAPDGRVTEFAQLLFGMRVWHYHSAVLFA